MKKLLTILLAGALAICACFSLIGCGAKNGTLKVGITDYAPMDYKEDGGCGGEKWIGFDADLAREVAKILDYDIEFVEIEWDNKVISINAKEIDVIWNGMTITDELKEALTISDPYLENSQVIVCQSSVKDSYTAINSLENASEILVEAGSAGEKAVKAAGFESKIKKATAQKDTLLEVKTSVQKVAVIDKLMAQVLVGEGTSYSDLTFKEVGFEKEEFGIGFRKEDTELCKKVNDAIKTLKENGKFAELQKKYFA